MESLIVYRVKTENGEISRSPVASYSTELDRVFQPYTFFTEKGNSWSRPASLEFAVQTARAVSNDGAWAEVESNQDGKIKFSTKKKA